MSRRSAALRQLAASLRAITADELGIFMAIALKQKLVEPESESPDRRDKRQAAAALDAELDAAKRLYRQARRKR
ncbi:MAG TPA: hypothetical protein VJK02_21105 [Anaerolineales bacterium]|nr:hypothetical protein [Anaerolineales bacterium]